jgi:type II secretory pathway pseudopilin PulG
MKASSPSGSRCGGFTLLELTLVIGILIALMGVGMSVSGSAKTWKLGRAASETLRSVYTAQKTYLADHPTSTVSSLTQSALLPYLPGGPSTFPTSTSSENGTLYVRVNVSPPYLTTTSGGTSGTRYDPSGSTTDSLWDVGE